MSVLEQTIALKCLSLIEDHDPNSLTWVRPPHVGKLDGLVHCAVCDTNIEQTDLTRHLQGGSKWFVSPHRRRRHTTGSNELHCGSNSLHCGSNELHCDSNESNCYDIEAHIDENHEQAFGRWHETWRLHGVGQFIVLEGCERVYCQICGVVQSHTLRDSGEVLRHIRSPCHKAAAARHVSIDWLAEIRYPALPCDYNCNGRGLKAIEAKIERNLRKRITSPEALALPAWQLFGTTLPRLRLHIQSQWDATMTWVNYGSWHLDHVLPVSAFHVDDPVHCLVLCHWTNIQPLWGHQNLAKGATIVGS